MDYNKNIKNKCLLCVEWCSAIGKIKLSETEELETEKRGNKDAEICTKSL